MPTKTPGRKYKTHRIKPGIDPELLAGIAKMYGDHVADKERRRLEVFERAWASLKGSAIEAHRVALAVAYLEGGSK